MYPEKPIYDIAGFPLIKGRDLVARLVEQAGRFNPTYRLGDPATTLARRPDGTIEVGTAAGAVIRCRAVLIGGGIGTFTPRPLPSGAEWVAAGCPTSCPIWTRTGARTSSSWAAATAPATGPCRWSRSPLR